MTDQRYVVAWNNFVMNSEPADYDVGDDKRAAAIAAQYMSLANNGGINSFLTCSNDLDATEVLESLVAVGALTAAKEYGEILRRLGAPIPRATQAERWHLLRSRWSRSLDALDVLSADADRDLMQALGRHVRLNEDFYAALDPGA